MTHLLNDCLPRWSHQPSEHITAFCTSKRSKPMVLSTPHDSIFPPATRCIAVCCMLGVLTCKSAPAAMRSRTSSTLPQDDAASSGVIPTAKPLPPPVDTVFGSAPASSIFRNLSADALCTCFLNLHETTDYLQ